MLALATSEQTLLVVMICEQHAVGDDPRAPHLRMQNYESIHIGDQNGTYLPNLFVALTPHLVLPLHQSESSLTYVMNLLRHVRAEQSGRR